MLQNIFRKYLKDQIGSKKHLIKRSNDALLQRIAICFNTLLENQAGVDYYTPIYGNNFNVNNKQRHNTLQILKQEKLIEIKTNKDGKESWQSKFSGKKIRNDINNPTPKSYRFTELGWSLIQQQDIADEIKQFTSSTKKATKYNSPEEFTGELLQKAAKDNLSLTFKLSKPLPVVVEDYFNAKKDEWNVTEKNYKSKYKQAKRKVLSVIRAFNNKMLSLNIRMYSALSFCPKELRQYILTPEGGHIDEGFDINSSIYTLLGDTLELYMKQKNIAIPKQFFKEKKKLQELCFAEEHIYSYIGRWNGGHWSKEQIKPHNMEVIFSNNEDIQKRDAKNSARNQIKNFIQTEFPTMWSILIHFEQEINEDYETELEQYNQFCDQISLYNAGLLKYKPKHVDQPKKVKSSIWRYFQTIETHIMLQLKHQLETEFNITAYWLHDCLCFDESTLTVELKTHIQTVFKQLIKSINHYQSFSIKSLNQSNDLLILYGDSKNRDNENNEIINDYELLLQEIDNSIMKGNKNEVLLVERI